MEVARPQRRGGSMWRRHNVGCSPRASLEPARPMRGPTNRRCSSGASAASSSTTWPLHRQPDLGWASRSDAASSSTTCPGVGLSIRRSIRGPGSPRDPARLRRTLRCGSECPLATFRGAHAGDSVRRHCNPAGRGRRRTHRCEPALEAGSHQAGGDAISWAAARRGRDATASSHRYPPARPRGGHRRASARERWRSAHGSPRPARRPP